MEGGSSAEPESPRESAAPAEKKASYGWPLGLSLLAVAALWAVPRWREAAARAREDAPRPWVDPAEARLVDVPEWVDPRWLEHLQAELARTPPFDVANTAFLEALKASLASLSFVERLERCELSSSGELLLELALRKPVACLPVRGDYLLVDADGVVLEGHWPLPPRLGAVVLPVLAADPLFERARPGDWLVEPEHEDALDVALSLSESLSAEERARLGRVVIDARRARLASIDEPGVRLELEGGRLALFGRSPASDEPGELAPAAKWRSLARALELFLGDPGAHDWSLVDLRWDRPELALKNAPLVVAHHEPRASAAAREEPRTRRARDPSRPHVR